jgi:hypothetical protein
MNGSWSPFVEARGCPHATPASSVDSCADWCPRQRQRHEVGAHLWERLGKATSGSHELDSAPHG